MIAYRRGNPLDLDAVIDLTFDIHRPEAYIKSIATSGGSGVIHHTVWNYTEIGDTLLTTDWFWGPYRVLCEDALRKLEAAKREERDQLRALAESGELDVNALYDRARGLSLAAAQVHKAREHQAAVDQEVMRRETAAFEAVRDVRKFEILCDREREERRLLAKQAEQRALDETRRPLRKETP